MAIDWQQYQLEGDPFGREQSPVTCYRSDQFKQLLDLLLHLGMSSNAVLLLVGVSGIGKTMLLEHMIARLDKQVGVCKIQGDLSITPDVFRYLLGKHLDLELPNDDRDSFYRALIPQLEKMHQNQQRYLLFVDNAHLMPERTLAAILDLMRRQAQDNPALHVLLFGGPQLETSMVHLTSQHKGEAVIHVSRMKPLTFKATQMYLNHRVKLMGEPSQPLFSERQEMDIYRRSGGIPSKINFFAKQSLEGNVPMSGSRQSKLPLRRIALIGGIIVAGIVLIIASFESIEHETPMVTRTTSLQDSLPVPLPLGQQQPIADSTPTTLSDVLVEETAVKKKVPPQTAKSAPPHEAFVDLIPLEDLAEEMDAKMQTTQEVPKPKAVIIQKKKLAKPVVAESKPTPVEKPKPVVAESKSASVENTPKKAAATVSPYTLDEQHLLATDSSHYTLQLMGSHDKQHLEDFVRATGIESKIVYARTNYEGRIWYIVLYGDYATQQLGRSAVKTLPRQVQAQQPWLRRIASIQNAIKSAKR